MTILTSPGFCVFGHDLQLLDLPLLQSHILCFYVDTLTALVLAWLARKHQGVTHPSRLLGLLGAASPTPHHLGPSTPLRASRYLHGTAILTPCSQPPQPLSPPPPPPPPQQMQGHAVLADAPAGIFMHGLAHLGLWAERLDGSSPDVPAGYLLEMSPATRLRKWAGLSLFFFLLLRSVSTL